MLKLLLSHDASRSIIKAKFLENNCSKSYFRFKNTTSIKEMISNTKIYVQRYSYSIIYDRNNLIIN